jgi:hypothetical protein
MSDKSLLSNPMGVAPLDDRDLNRSPPVPSSDCLYGLVGDIAKAGSVNSEANPYAIALNALVYIGCALGRTTYLMVGDTQHHPRIFGLHVGGSGRGRKGDALSLCRLLHKAVSRLSKQTAPGTHYGGLSSAEGLVQLVHDGYKDGKNEVPPVLDKRLWVVESEFANVLQQTKREGNTLSAAIRNLYDGAGIRPATKSNRIGVDEPHVCISGGITPSELRSALSARELTNGFANRLLMIWAERTRSIAFPQPTPCEVVETLAMRIIRVVEFAEESIRDITRPDGISLTPSAKELYSELYTTELCDQDSHGLIATLLQRRAPTVLRIAMIFALTDLTKVITDRHIHAAAAWTRHWAESVKYIFVSAGAEDQSSETSKTSEKILKFLITRESATRTQLSVDCFGGHLNKQKIDQALQFLLTGAPPKVLIDVRPRLNGPGSPTKHYRLAAQSAKSANTVIVGGSAFVADQEPPANTANSPSMPMNSLTSQYSRSHSHHWSVASPPLGH